MTKTLCVIFAMLSLKAFSNPGDTTIVQTFTFEDQNNPFTAYDYPGRRFFDFPADDGTTYQKVLMYHTLKCFEDGNAGGLQFPCGEWDYLTYNYLFQHLGIYDSIPASHSLYYWNNSDFTAVEVTTEPTYDIYQYEQQTLVIDQFGAENAIPILGGNESNTAVFGGAQNGRAQFIWTSTELLEMGLTAGEIDGLVLPNLATGSYSHFKIRIKTISNTNLTSWSQGGWEDVYEQDTELTENSTKIYFTTPFSWNGTSNLIFDFSYTNRIEQPAIPLLGESSSSNLSLAYHGQERVGAFNLRDQVRSHNEWFNSLTDQVTIAFWLNGDPAIQPANGSCFEGLNASNERVLNAHVPWSNGRVYWDAGYFFGYDRIDKLAAESQFEGNWNHYAFTKNATTGVMRIYVNGSSWHAATGMDNVFEELQNFLIGSGASNSNFYQGNMDDFIVLNTELNAASIADLMRNGATSESSFAENIQLYHTFDSSDYSSFDQLNGMSSTYIGSVDHELLKGSEIFNKATSVNWRPNLSILQSEHDAHIETSIEQEQIERPLTSLVSYDTLNHQVIETSISYYFPGGYSYIFDAFGEKLDSTYIESSFDIENETFTYFNAPFEVTERYELGRYITPYGINLTLGVDGWTWVFDVTDFEPLLHGSVELEAGNWQELLDLKFVFIEGPEPREVKRIENVWNGNFNLNTFDNSVTEQTLGMQEGEVGLKLRTTVTGHGFGFDNNNCGEFCYNTHSVKVNGNEEWSWEIMQDCDEIPLYPQGGTWLFARAGWCPGMEGRTQEFELTPFIQNGEVNVDYDITYDPYGNYVTEAQAIFYGPIAFSHDAEILDINAPSNWKIKSRINPICDEPRVVIRNKGSEPLTSVVLTYKVDGGAEQSYTWNGYLEFMESEEVVLSYDDPILWENDDMVEGRFIVDLSNDDNAFNNHGEIKFNRPPVLQYTNLDDNRIIIILRTNNAFQETSYKLYDIDDNVIYQRNDFDSPNTFYRDTIALNQGCYRFEVYDTEGDGLSFFANNDGSGQIKIDRVAGPDFKAFNADFGREITYYFYFSTNLVSVEEYDTFNVQPLVYPNPAIESAFIRFNDQVGDYHISVSDAVGRNVANYYWKKTALNEEYQIPMHDFSKGFYIINIHDQNHVYSLKVLKE